MRRREWAAPPGAVAPGDLGVRGDSECEEAPGRPASPSVDPSSKQGAGRVGGVEKGIISFPRRPSRDDQHRQGAPTSTRKGGVSPNSRLHSITRRR